MNALETWNTKLSEIWQLVSQSPQSFKGGGIWDTIVDINGGIKAIAYGLLVIFFAISIFSSASNFKDFKRPEHALRHFIRFAGAKVAVTYGLDILLMIISISTGVMSSVAGQFSNLTGATATLPDVIKTAVGQVDFGTGLLLGIVTMLGSLIITVLSFYIILICYGRFFRIYLLSALAPLPLSSFAGEGTASSGKAFIKSYIGYCMEGAVIIVSCIIFSAFMSSSGLAVPDPNMSAGTIVWNYLGETIFYMLVLVGMIKGSNAICKEMMGLH